MLQLVQVVWKDANQPIAAWQHLADLVEIYAAEILHREPVSYDSTVGSFI